MSIKNILILLVCSFITSLQGVSLPKDYQARITKLKTLISKYESNIKYYQSKEFSEAETRQEFLDPFLRLLGWNVLNEKQVFLYLQDTIPEARLKINQTIKYADYGIRTRGRAVFYLEAKAIFKDIDKKQYVFQAKRYSWSSMQSDVAILSDFEDFRVYETSKTPQINKSQIGEIKEFHLNYKDYVRNFSKLYKTFSKEAVLEGSLKSLIEKNRIIPDEKLIKTMDEFRIDLANDLYKKNPFLKIKALDEKVNRIVHQILFARILEDRDITTTRRLDFILRKYKKGNGKSLFKNVLREFEALLKSYGGETFKTASIQNIKVSDSVLKKWIKQFYPPISPYDFSIIPVHILGKSFENFLGRRLKIVGGEIKSETKPSVKEAGRVFYTPRFLTHYAIKDTLSKKLEGRKIEDWKQVKILDPACGNGAFLIATCEYLFERARAYYLHFPNQIKNRNNEFPDAYYIDGLFKLGVKKKMKLVQNNLYGIDLSKQGVSNVKMWLAILILSKEGSCILNKERKYKIPNRRVPRKIENLKLVLLDKNIVEENIFLENKQFKKNKNMKKNLSILNQGGFDTIISAPPSIPLQRLNKKTWWKKINLKNYKNLSKMGDLYTFYYKRGLNLLKPRGSLAYVTSDKWIKHGYGKAFKTS